MQSLQGFISQELYNQKVLPKKYEDLVPKLRDPIVEYKWRNYFTGAISSGSGKVPDGSMWTLERYVDDVHDASFNISYDCNWEIKARMGAWLSNTGNSICRISNSPLRQYENCGYVMAGLANYNANYKQTLIESGSVARIFLQVPGAQLEFTKSNPIEVHLIFNKDTQFLTANYTNGTLTRQYNNSQYQYRGYTTKFVLWNESYTDKLYFQNVAIKYDGNVLYRGSGISI